MCHVVRWNISEGSVRGWRIADHRGCCISPLLYKEIIIWLYTDKNQKEKFPFQIAEKYHEILGSCGKLSQDFISMDGPIIRIFSTQIKESRS